MGLLLYIIKGKHAILLFMLAFYMLKGIYQRPNDYQNFHSKNENLNLNSKHLITDERIQISNKTQTWYQNKCFGKCIEQNICERKNIKV